MSQENMEVVRRCCDAFDRGDYEAALEPFAPDIEYDLSHFPDGGIYRGHEGVREAFRIWMGTWENYRQERDEPVDAGDQVIVPTREYGRGKGSGVSLQRPTFGVWTLRDGQVVRIHFYATMAEALEAVGLSGVGVSRENVEIVREALRAFEGEDPEGLVNCFHANVELLLPRNVLEGGSYRGHEGVRRALADAFETWEAFRFDIEDIRAVDDRVVVLGRTTAVGKSDVPAVEYPSAYLFMMREGRIVYLRPYQNHIEALEAAGLSE